MNEKQNECPVCGEPLKEDEEQIYCEDCGYNIPKDEHKQNTPPKSA